MLIFTCDALLLQQLTRSSPEYLFGGKWCFFRHSRAYNVAVQIIISYTLKLGEDSFTNPHGVLKDRNSVQIQKYFTSKNAFFVLSKSL